MDKPLPVDLYIPGCPPKPEAILHGVAQLLQIAQKHVAPVIEAQVTAEEQERTGRGEERTET